MKMGITSILINYWYNLKLHPMKKLIFMAFTLLSISIYAQEKLPDVYSVTSQFDRIEIVRMKPGTDMLEGLGKFINEKNIKKSSQSSGKAKRISIIE